MGTIVIWPNLMADLNFSEVSAGALGILLVVAYVAGQLIQAVGNVLSSVWWRAWGGWPTYWPVIDKGNLITGSQKKKLETLIHSKLGHTEITIDKSLKSPDWQPIFRQIYVAVRAAKRDEYVNIFNGNYGMHRGIAAATFVCAGAILLVHGSVAWPISIAFLLVTSISLFRMHRFAKYYVQETILQFLEIPESQGELN